MAIFSNNIRKLIHGRPGADTHPASAQAKTLKRNPPSIFDAQTGNPPILAPESPLINFFSKLTPNQRRGIKHIQVTEPLGYDVDYVFQDGEALYRWLTPGDRIITTFVWPAERHRKQWFRVHLTAPYVFQFADFVAGADSMNHIVGRAGF